MADPDRRDPGQPDRRTGPTLNVPGGRRSTDPEPSHGTRARYLRRCRCTPCRAANAAYLAAWRTHRASGRALLGARMSALEAQHLIRLMLRERWTKHQLAKELGLGRNLARLTHQDMIRLRTALKVRRFYRLRVADPSQPPFETGA